MSLAVVYARAKLGIEAPLVTVEAHLSNGLPSLSIVGLPEAAVKESRDRVRSAILNSQFEFPARRITINLAPADLPKEGGRYDLAIALSLLAASGQIPSHELHQFEFIGELALTGELRPTPGVLPASIQCSQQKRLLFVPQTNASEAALPEQAQIISARHLLDITAHLSGQQKLSLHKNPEKPALKSPIALDLKDVRGQYQAKRALEIAAAGHHNLLFSGPPGSGKSMLAARLPSILPDLRESDAMEVAAIHSIANQPFNLEYWLHPPYRSPHHTASAVALVGGGSNPKPGEISLAHRGVLFLDELPEYDRRVLEVLREPLEAGHINISRANHQVNFPARFQLIAAMNPCPCGYLGHGKIHCQCSGEQIRRYRQKVSGPLLDRIDLQIHVPANTKEVIETSNQDSEKSEVIKSRVINAQYRQLSRQGSLNAELTTQQLENICSLSEENRDLMAQAVDRLSLSARAYHRALKVARTIADLADNQQIESAHLLEALSLKKGEGF